MIGRGVEHVLRLTSVAFVALSMNWATLDEWGHASVSAALGLVAYAAAEQTRRL